MATEAPPSAPRPAAPGDTLDRFFHISERGSNVRTEIIAGLATFLTMSYILFVNPSIIAGLKDHTGHALQFQQVLTVTALVVASKLTWPQAMGVIVVEGLVISALVLTGFREAVLNAIPMDLKRSIGIGIGLFIALIGFVNAGVVIPGPPGVPVTIVHNFRSWPLLIFAIGFVVTAALVARKMRGALLLGIVFTTVLATIVNEIKHLKVFTDGSAVVPHHWPAPSFSLLGKFTFDFWSVLGTGTAIAIVLSVMLSDFFDTMGTVIGIAGEAGWLGADGTLPRLNRVLLVDSLAAVAGGAAGASSATTYVESAAGVAAGARTGLASVVTGGCFLLALFFAPLAGVVPPAATAPALIVVGYLMTRIVRDIPFHDLDEGFPALLTLAMMPFTYSITNGIGAGLVAYCFIKLVRGRGSEVRPMMYGTALAFIVYFAAPWLAGR